MKSSVSSFSNNLLNISEQYSQTATRISNKIIKNSSITSFSNSKEEVKTNLLNISKQYLSSTEEFVVHDISKNSSVFNIYFEKKIPSWKATEEIPNILVISANPPIIYVYPQEWGGISESFTWDLFIETDSWDNYDRPYIPQEVENSGFWCSHTCDRDGGIINETVVVGTIYDDQE